MEKENNKKIISLVLIIFTIILIIAGVSYAYFNVVLKGSRINSITAGQVIFSFEEENNAIDISGSTGISDVEAIASAEAFDFHVSSEAAKTTNVNYEIFITEDSANNTIDSSFIKLYLTTDTNTVLREPVEISNLVAMEDVEDSYLLYSNSFSLTNITSFIEHGYKLRAWISDEYDINDNITYNNQNKQHSGTLGGGTYKFNVNVRTVTNLVSDYRKPNCSLTISNPTVRENSKTLTITSTSDDLITDAYSFNNLTFSTTTTKTIEANGIYYGYVKDTAGNVGTCSLKVSTINEAVTVPIISSTTTSSTWSDSNQTLTINGSTSNNPISYYEYYISTSTTIVPVVSTYSWLRYDNNNKPVIDTDGIYYIYARAVNSNNKKSSITNPYIIKIDKTNPSATFAIKSGTLGDNSFYTSNITVTLNAVVGASNLKTLKYCIATRVGDTFTCDSTNGILVLSSSKDITMSTTNNYKICAYIENNGNVSNIICSNEYKLDKTLPTCSLSISNSSLTITSTDTDLATNAYSFNKVAFANTNTTTITENGKYLGYVKDTAGNVASCTINVSTIN